MRCPTIPNPSTLFRKHAVVSAVAMALSACGGGGGDAQSVVASAASTAIESSVVAAAPEVGQVVAVAADSAVAVMDAEPGPQAAEAMAGQPAGAAGVSSADVTAAPEATMPAQTLATTEGMVTAQAVSATAPAPTLAALPVVQRLLLDSVRATSGCRAGFVPPAYLAAGAPVTTAAPITMDAADITAARIQLGAGPFLKVGDFKSGSPDEMARLQRNRASFLSGGEAVWTATTDQQLRSTHGTLARDAAFVHLLRPEAALLAGLKSYLLAQAANAYNDFSAQLCIRNADGSIRDASFGEASWLARYIATYDAVRTGLPAADRLRIENFIRRNAYFLAAQQDYGLSALFPKRASGNYLVRGASAAATTDSDRWQSQRVDTNGDCNVDAKDDARVFPVYAYAKADGSAGPRISVLSQWYNNRRSLSAMAMGAAGVLLNDSELTVRAKRYFMEWLTYAVWADGSEGEYNRNGDYCVANQGIIYAQSNVQGAALLADLLARRGDRDLIDFSTRDGLFGTEAATGQASKSIETVIGTHLALAQGQRAWYRHRGDLVRQTVQPSTHLGRMDARIFNAARATDSYHHLGLLLAAKRFPGQPIKAVVLRDATVTTLRWPGSTGNAVATGYGSWAGAWTDVMNFYPSALLMRAP